MPHIFGINPQKPDQDSITEITQLILSGKTFIYPTETFYAIGALYNDEPSLKKVFKLKTRDLNNPLPLLIPDIGFLNKITSEIKSSAAKIADYFWPGPLTLLFRASDSLSHTITAGSGKVGCRVSGFGFINSILKEINSAITTTSANISGKKNNSKISKISPSIINAADFIIEVGMTTGGLPSTILDVTEEPFQVKREGAIKTSLILDYYSSIT